MRREPGFTKLSEYLLAFLGFASLGGIPDHHNECCSMESGIQTKSLHCRLIRRDTYMLLTASPHRAADISVEFSFKAERRIRKHRKR